MKESSLKIARSIFVEILDGTTCVIVATEVPQARKSKSGVPMVFSDGNWDCTLVLRS